MGLLISKNITGSTVTSYGKFIETSPASKNFILYACISSLAIKNKTSVAAIVYFYDSQLKTNCIDIKEYDFTSSVAEDSKNLYKQTYAYLKTQPDFIGYSDVLEANQLA